MASIFSGIGSLIEGVGAVGVMTKDVLVGTSDIGSAVKKQIINCFEPEEELSEEEQALQKKKNLILAKAKAIKEIVEATGCTPEEAEKALE